MDLQPPYKIPLLRIQQDWQGFANIWQSSQENVLQLVLGVLKVHKLQMIYLVISIFDKTLLFKTAKNMRKVPRKKAIFT